MKLSNKNIIKDFLIKEYENLAQAHFNTIQLISTFFRYYILILSIVFAAVGTSIHFTDNTNLTNTIFCPLYSSIILIIISIIGLLILLYICNLRFDAILYARAINGIRKYFYDSFYSTIDESTIRVMPKTTEFPKYFEPLFFLPVVLTFSILNSFFLFSGCFIFSSFLNWRYCCFIALAYAVLHVVLYKFLAFYREKRYMDFG